jgi:hypothetical protein
MTNEFSDANGNNARLAPRRVIDTHNRATPGAPLVGERGTEVVVAEARSCIDHVRDFPADASDPGAQLKHLILRQAEAVAQIRGSMPVSFAGDEFPCEVIVKRRKWSRQLEEQWACVVGACMNLGYLDQGDPLITARLILGMICATAQQRQPVELVSAQQITRAVVTLLHLEPDSG